MEVRYGAATDFVCASPIQWTGLVEMLLGEGPFVYGRTAFEADHKEGFETEADAKEWALARARELNGFG